jgi:two-component system, cell cycle response regulator
VKDEDFYDSTVEVTVSRDMSSFMRVAEQQQAMLLVLSGARIGHRVVLGEASLTIGRGSTCELILDADSVSRQHAIVEFSGGSYRLLDKGSTNGTFVNHHRIRERVLNDGDQIQIGKALLKYLAGGNIEAVYHEEFERLMHHDGLTGARTKASFEEAYRIALMVERSKPKVVSLIVFDIDHFKQVNDTHGHTCGDAVLQQLSAIVKDLVASRYLFGRLGGEEFGVLLEGEGGPQACELAEQIRARIEHAHFSFEDVHIPITVSLGVAERAAGSVETAEDFFERADQRLYTAKAEGRNCVRC